MDYPKQTVDQIKKILKERGVDFPSKSRKADLVDMLLQDDTKNKQNSARGPGGSKANLTEASGSLTKASVDSSTKEVWIVVTESTDHGNNYEVDSEIVGVFTSKKDAIKNAKAAFANMEGSTEASWKDVDDYSMQIGETGGVLFEVELGGEGDTNRVRIKKSFLNKDIKAKYQFCEDSEDSDE